MVYLIVFLPLLGSIIAGFWGRRLGDKLSLYLTSTLLLISCGNGWTQAKKNELYSECEVMQNKIKNSRL